MLFQLAVYAQSDTFPSVGKTRSSWAGLAPFSLEIGGGITTTRIIHTNEKEREWSAPMLYDQGYVGSLTVRKSLWKKHLYATATLSYQQLQVYSNLYYTDYSTPDFVQVPVKVAAGISH